MASSNKYVGVLADTDDAHRAHKYRLIAGYSKEDTHNGVLVSSLDLVVMTISRLQKVFPGITYKPLLLTSSVCKKIRKSGLCAVLSSEEIARCM
jgi:hypothetical protein